MKKLLRLAVAAVLVALVMVAFVMPAAAADNAGVVTAWSTTLTNNATHTLASTVGWVKVDRSGSAGVWVKFQGNASGTGNVVTAWARSADGRSYETSPPTSMKFTNALNGTTAVVGFHPIAADLLRGVHSLKLVSVQNADSTASGTNVVIGIGKKNGL